MSTGVIFSLKLKVSVVCLFMVLVYKHPYDLRLSISEEPVVMVGGGGVVPSGRSFLPVIEGWLPGCVCLII